MKARLLAGAVTAPILLALLLGACGADTPGAPPAPDHAEAVAQTAQTARARGPRRMADGLLPGMVRYRGTGRTQDANPTCAAPHLQYWTGPVLQSPVIVGVFWTASVNATLQANIGQFFSDLTQSSYWGWLHEYDTVGLGATEQAILPGSWGGNFTITPLKCAPGGNNCKLADADLQAELTRQIDMGALPPPALDCTGNASTLYVIELPPNVSLSGPMGSGNSCAANGFCAYHYTGTYGPNKVPLVYAAMMDYFTGPCAFGCAANGTRLANTTDIHSHEISEAVTDPEVGLDPDPVNYAAPAAWGDDTCGEIADICADGSPGDTVTVSGRSWVVQQLWSNQQGKCTSTGPVPPICSGTTVTGCRKCSCGDDGLSCNGSTAVCETGTGNVLYGGCEVCTSKDDTCTGGGGTCQQSATPSQDDICTGCTPLTQCPSGQACGTAPDGCGGTLSCGTCAAPQTCGGGGVPNQCGCAPLTKCPAGQTCGTASDGCGGSLSCGTCAAPQTCGGGGVPNQCGCAPLTTCPAGDDCGTVPDGCGGVRSCGSCPSGQTCGGGGVPNHCGGATCTPKTCAQLGYDCGLASDGCTGMIFCGSCPSGQSCGGGGKPNVCGTGCKPISCAQQGVQCGTVGDGCGNTLNCGSCPAGETCGGGGVPGQCGCAPLKICPSGFDCGTLQDGCGGILDCGTCPAGESCGGGNPGTPNHCGCSPKTVCPSGEDCGTAPDGCGGTTFCGTCAPGLTCGGGGLPNHCGCVPIDACPAGNQCGSVPDGCGGTLSCGTCSVGQECSGNHCFGGTPDAGTDSGSGSASSSSGGTGGAEGEPFPVYGRATCSTSVSHGAGEDPALGVIALAGLAALGERRRRRR